MGKYEPILRIADLGNLTRAAEALGYSQSSLSYIVNSIEQELGTKLFFRDHRGVTLTKSGTTLIEIMARIENLETKLKGTATALQNAFLQVGTFNEISLTWLPDLLRNFQQQQPDTRIQIIQGYTCNDLINAFQHGELDCAFALGEILSQSTSLQEFCPMCKDAYYVVTPEDSPLAQHSAVTMEILLQQPPPTFLPSSEYLTQSPISDLFHQFTPTYNMYTRYSDDATVLHLVETGAGFSILPGLLLSAFPQRHVNAIPLDPPRYRTVGLLYRTQESSRGVVNAFLQLTKEYAASHPPFSVPLP